MDYSILGFVIGVVFMLISIGLISDQIKKLRKAEKERDNAERELQKYLKRVTKDEDEEE